MTSASQAFSGNLSTLGKVGVAVLGAFCVKKLVSSSSFRTESEDLRPLPEPPAGSKFITLPKSKLKLRYTDTTKSKISNEDVTFVLLHGFAGVLESWKFLIPHLTKKISNCRILSLDLVGSGFSDKPIGEDFNYSYRNQGGIVGEFLSTLGLSKVVLVGHSSGTVVAAAAALECPSRVIGAVFINNALFRAKSDLYSNPWLKSFFGWGASKMMTNRKKSLSRMHHPNSIEKILKDDFVKEFEAPTRLPNFLVALVETVTAKEPPYINLFEELLASFPPFPILFVYGKDDTYKPLPSEQAVSIQEKLDTMEPERRTKQIIETISLDECAHYAQHEQPEALAEAIQNFICKFS